MSATMPFGKYRGQLLANLPDDYIDWLFSLDDLRPALSAAIEQEWRLRFERRDTPSPSPTGRLSPAAREWVDRFIAGGFRQCAKAAHPDVGGSHADMLALNELVNFIREVAQ